MILRDGKFYEGNVLVPLEFGNKEQIRLMNEAKEHIEALKGDGLEVDVQIETKYFANIDLKCLCGQTVWFNDIELDDDDKLDDLDGECTSCPKCKKRYELSYDSGQTLVKLVR